MDQSEAISIFQAVDKAGFSCTLGLMVSDRNERLYEVNVNLKGLGMERLSDLHEAVNRVAPDDVLNRVDDYGHLVVM